MSFKSKPPALKVVAASIAEPSLPDVSWFMDDDGKIDRKQFISWTRGREETEWAEAALAGLEQWHHHHAANTPAETASRAAAIAEAVEGFAACYPSSRLAAGYARIAAEDWCDHTATVIRETARDMRRTLKSPPPIAAVRERLQATTQRLFSAFHYLESSRDAYRRAVAKGEEWAAGMSETLRTNGVNLSPADMQSAHDFLCHVPIGAPVEEFQKPNLARWRRLTTALQNGEPWAAPWMRDAACHERAWGDPTPQTEEEENRWWDHMRTRATELTAALNAGLEGKSDV